MELPSTSQQQSLGQNTPERVPPIDRNDNDDQDQQTNQVGHNTPFGVLSNASQKLMVFGQTTPSRVPPTCTDTDEKSDETLSLATPNLFFQRNEIQKMYIQVVRKKMTIILVLHQVHMMKTRIIGFSPQRNIMMLWKLDLKHRHL